MGVDWPVAADAILETQNQWWRLAVTAASPTHVMHLGKGVADAFDGFTVHTDDHIWMHATDGSDRSPRGGGKLVAQSEGRAWVQSNSETVSFIADKKVVFASGASSVTAAGAGGVTLLTDGRIEGGDASPGDPKGGTTNKTEEDAADIAGDWGQWWTQFDTATAIGLNVMDVAMATALTGIPVPTSPMGWISTVIGAGANFAGAGVNLAGTVGADLPGSMSLLSEAGISIGSPIAVNIWGGPGAVLGGASTTVFGGVSTGVLAGMDASVQAVGPVDLSAVALASVASISKRSDAGVELASRGGPTVIQGTLGWTMQGGSVQARALTTGRVTAGGWLDLFAPKGQVALKSSVITTITATTALAFGLTPAAKLSGKVGAAVELVELAGPKVWPYIPKPPRGKPRLAITIAKGVDMSFGDPVKPLIKITADSIEMSNGPTSTITVDAAAIRLEAGGASANFEQGEITVDSYEAFFE